jgi:hypothetical protein
MTDGKLSMRGWAYDSIKNNAFDEIYLVLRNKTTYYKITLQKEVRTDVATAFNNKALTTSGFTVKLIDMTILPKGIYQYLFATSLDDEVMFIDMKSKLKI